MKTEIIGAYRLLITCSPEGAVVVYLQESKKGKWAYVMDCNDCPIMANHIGYIRGVAEGRIKYGQKATRTNGDRYEPTTRKQIVKALMSDLGIGYFPALLLTFKHRNQWGHPESAFIIALTVRRERKQKGDKEL